MTKPGNFDTKLSQKNQSYSKEKHMESNKTEDLVDLNAHLNLFDNNHKFENTDEIVRSLKEGKLYSVFLEKNPRPNP